MKKNVPDSPLGKLYNEHIDFIIAHNVEGLLNQYAPDCVLISSMTPDKQPLYVRGHQELEEFFRSRIFTLKDLSAAGLRKYRNDLAAMVAIVKKNAEAGRSPEDMLRDDVLKEYKAAYSYLDWIGPDSWLRRIVDQMRSGALK